LAEIDLPSVKNGESVFALRLCWKA